ncbi:MAG: hypothetical protein AVDCRST_MAG29-1502, partial [uncultured Nocardioidaceae bacterium]
CWRHRSSPCSSSCRWRSPGSRCTCCTSCSRARP